jgi:hypothetical protein
VPDTGRTDGPVLPDNRDREKSYCDYRGGIIFWKCGKEKKQVKANFRSDHYEKINYWKNKCSLIRWQGKVGI